MGRFHYTAAALCAAAAMLAGCGGSQPLIGNTGAMPQGRAISTRPDAGRSWMNPTAKREPLLYVSSSDNYQVYVYTYPKAKLVGKLVGFNLPAGLCSDGKGNVFITNYNGANIIEYAHGGTKPVATLSDPGTHPSGCAIDPTTGNLAVTGILKSVNGPSQDGAFAIFSNATGTPSLYSVPYATTEFCGYDKKGNLFVDGMGWGEEPRFVLSELRKGQTSAETVSLDNSPGGPGAVQWHGKTLSIGDTYAQINQYAIKAGSGTQVGSVKVNSRMGQFWIQGSRVIVPTYLGYNPPVQVYTYPGGAGPIKTITDPQSPYGVTVSLPPSN